MIKTAIDAGLPLITGQTDDEVNIKAVLAALTDKKVRLIPSGSTPQKVMEAFQQLPPQKNQQYLFASVRPGFIASSTVNDLYKKLTQANATLLVLNPEKKYNAMFDVGVITPPLVMVRELLHTFVDDDMVEALVPACHGMSLKDITEVCLLASTTHGEVTPQSVLEARRLYMQHLRGIEQVSTELDFYMKNTQLEAWIDQNRQFMLDDNVPLSLRPRGLLLDGPPGTGKTLAAKIIARETGFPLYRLSLGGVLNKYVGESESNMEQSLASVTQAAPCVFLMDEVEKLFNGQSDSGVTSRLLSMLLWWLQEHKENVFTVMTTNKKSALPEELYRPGRIDQVIELKGFSHDEAKEFMEGFLQQFQNYIELPEGSFAAKKILSKSTVNSEGCFNPAELRASVIQWVKSLSAHH